MIVWRVAYVFICADLWFFWHVLDGLILHNSLTNNNYFISGLSYIESSSGASGSVRGGAYLTKQHPKLHSTSSMPQHRETIVLTGATPSKATASCVPSTLPSTEDLNSRCGSRQSLLDSTSHRSHVSIAVPAHQYSNAGCTSSAVPSGDVVDNRYTGGTSQPSPGR